MGNFGSNPASVSGGKTPPNTKYFMLNTYYILHVSLSCCEMSSSGKYSLSFMLQFQIFMAKCLLMQQLHECEREAVKFVVACICLVSHTLTQVKESGSAASGLKLGYLSRLQ